MVWLPSMLFESSRHIVTLRLTLASMAIGALVGAGFSTATLVHHRRVELPTERSFAELA